LDPRLARVLHCYAAFAPPELDLTIICGHRNQADQTAAFEAKRSKTPWPRSKHNSKPARAFDFIPAPFSAPGDWRDALRFARIAGAVLWVAAQEKVPMRWGGDWDQDGRSLDETFLDLGHLELL
jgi:peptidoglycan L-alanyl-D-glutamate endopeptidase CwlK